MLELFHVTSIPYGGRPSRGISITCGRCSREEAVHVNALKKSSGDDDAQLHRLAARKFEAMGWRVGKAKSRHRCPQCIADARAAQMRFLHANQPDKYKHANRGADKVPSNNVVDMPKTKPEPAVEPPHADKPREMGTTEGRVIFQKLEEHYGENRYLAGWTDERVADDLGAPVAWVKTVREKFFGPVGSNPEIDSLLSEAARWRAELVALLERATVLQAETKRLTDRAEIIERRFAEITKAVGK